MAKKKNFSGPSYTELIEPVFEALIELGGSGSNDEIAEKIIEMLHLPDNIVDEIHASSSGQKTELRYQLAWARSYLKKYGAITNTSRGIWMITPEFSDREKVDGKEVAKAFYADKKETDHDGETLPEDDFPEELEPWRTELAEILYSMNAYAFERLAQLLLRECGFSQVEVTKKSGDGGIDGTGKLSINGVLSFNVAFQCKRYSGAVSAGEIRDFRGALTTDIEKSIFITTGVFTQAAKEEASIAGKQQIDLMDGDELIDKLLELRLGVREKTIFEVDKEFFDKI